MTLGGSVETSMCWTAGTGDARGTVCCTTEGKDTGVEEAS